MEIPIVKIEFSVVKMYQYGRYRRLLNRLKTCIMPYSKYKTTTTNRSRPPLAQLDPPGRTDRWTQFNEKSAELDPLSVSLEEMQRFISRRHYLTIQRVNDQESQAKYSTDFTDFLISWCGAKCQEIDRGVLDPVDAAFMVAEAMQSMKMTFKEVKKKKKPRGRHLVEMSRLYSLGLQRLAERSENVEGEPNIVNGILCRYANACCDFNFDPSTSDVDLWPYWYRVSKFYLEDVDSDSNWQAEANRRQKRKQEFAEAYAYLLSIIIDVTLSFRRAYEFGTLKFAWESRIATYISNFSDRNSYILSLRLATLAQQHGLEFEHIVAKQLMVRGIQRSFDEYQFRKGVSSKPTRTVQDLFKTDRTEP